MFGVDLFGRVRLAILGQGLNQRPVPLRQNRIFPKGNFTLIAMIVGNEDESKIVKPAGSRRVGC